MDIQTTSNKNYFIGGINGVGKTTILTEISKKDSNFEVIKISICLMNWLGIKEKDSIAFTKVPESIKSRELVKMMESLIKRGQLSKKTLLFDSHYIIPTNRGLVEATGNWISNMDSLFILTSPAEEILARIEGEEIKTGRQRSIINTNMPQKQKLNILRIYQEKCLDCAKSISKKYKLPLYEITNESGKIDLTVASFINIHNTLIHNMPNKT